MKQISFICFRVYLEVYVIKNPMPLGMGVSDEDMPKIADEWWAHTTIETALKE